MIDAELQPQMIDQDECVAEQSASDRWQKIESLITGWIEKGRTTRLLVKQNQEVVAQVPVSAGLIGAILAPKLTLLGAVAALAGGCRLEIEPIKTSGADVLEALDSLSAPDTLDTALKTGVSEVTDLLDEVGLSDARVARDAGVARVAAEDHMEDHTFR